MSFFNLGNHSTQENDGQLGADEIDEPYDFDYEDTEPSSGVFDVNMDANNYTETYDYEHNAEIPCKFHASISF